MNDNIVNRLTRAPLSRGRFFVLFVLASMIFLAVAALLGLNFGLKNVLYLFLPFAAACLLIALGLIVRRFYDAGMPGLPIGIASFLLMGGLFGTGNFGLGLVALTLVVAVACFAPTRDDALISNA